MYEIDKLASLSIGVQGENGARNIEVDMTSWAEEFPGASFHVLFKAYNEAYASPMTSTRTGNILTWNVTLGATQTAGVGYTEIRAINPTTGLVKKTKIIPTSVERSVTGYDTASVPPPYTDWVNGVLAAADDAEDAKDAAETAQAAAEEALEEFTPTAEFVNETMTAQGYRLTGEDIGWEDNRLGKNDYPATSATESHTDYLPVFGGQKLYFKTHMSTNAYCFLYDYNKGILASYHPSSGTAADAYEADITLPGNAAWLRLSCSDAYIEDTEVFVKGAAGAISEALSRADDSPMRALSFTLTQKKRISGEDGSESASTSENMYATSMIDVHDVSKVYFVTAFNNGEHGYAFYNNGVFVSGKRGDAIEQSQYKKHYTVDVPDNADGLRFTCYAAGNGNYMYTTDCVVYAVPRCADIRKTVGGFDGRIAANTTAIAANAASIAANTTAIAANTSGISTNAAAITQNTTDIGELENRVDTPSFALPFTLQATYYISTTYNGVRKSETMDTIGSGQYYRYWWSKWIDIRGVDKIRLNTIFTSSSGYAFRKGDQLTVSMWIRPMASAAWQRLFDFGHDSSHYIYLTTSTGTTSRLAMKAGTNEQTIDFQRFTVGKWHHVVVTLAPGTAAVYVNGKAVAQREEIPFGISDIVPIINYFGRSQASSSTYFQGNLEDVRLYNYALTADEVSQLYDTVSAIETTQQDSPAATIHSLDGMRLQQPRHGLNIINGKVQLNR